MTNAASQSAPAGIHSIDHFALTLPDVEKARHFIAAFGLRVEQSQDELRLRASGSEHVWTRILPDAKKGLAYLSVGCFEADFETLKAQVASAGGQRAMPHPRADEQGHWFHDPDGNLVQLKIARKTQPDAKAPLPDASVPAGVRGVKGRSGVAVVQPRRLSHILLFTPDVARAFGFYQKALGLNLSDRSGNVIAFLHARHGSDHHVLAFAGSPGKGFHHSSWDVASLDDLGVASMQMRAAGYGHHWGVGHHVLGSNYFDYVQGPGGAWWEFSCHIDYIPSGTTWPAGDYPPEDALYLWGPDLPPDFIENTELQA